MFLEIIRLIMLSLKQEAILEGLNLVETVEVEIHEDLELNDHNHIIGNDLKPAKLKKNYATR